MEVLYDFQIESFHPGIVAGDCRNDTGCFESPNRSSTDE
jgi:hypothetical protein